MRQICSPLSSKTNERQGSPRAQAASTMWELIVVFPVLFWLLVTARRPVRASRSLTRLGAVSFPLYAAHMPLLTLCLALAVPRPVSAALAVGGSLLLSSASGRVDYRAIGRRVLTAARQIGRTPPLHMRSLRRVPGRGM